MSLLRSMRAGWLDDLTNWLRDLVEGLFSALVDLVKDAVLWVVEAALDLFATAIELIPVPDFLSGTSIASMLGSAGPTVAWCVSTFKIGECFALVAAAYAFRLLRKLLTLGQW